jgi:hypothetical protein
LPQQTVSNSDIFITPFFLSFQYNLSTGLVNPQIYSSTFCVSFK